MTLEGKVVVVTGGGRGIGRAIVEGFLREGSKVVALEMHWKGAESFEDELKRSDNGLPLTADVTNEATLEEAFKATIEAFGTVDVIVNNAGYRQRDVSPTGSINVLDIPPAQWQRMLDVNTTGPWNVIRHFIPPMLEKKAGSIVNVGSFGGDRGRAGDMPYGLSKAAFTIWVQALAEELRPDNIACNIFSPEVTRTTGWDEKRRAQEAESALIATPPSPVRTGVGLLKPESCVPLVLFFAQQDARVTGYYVNHVLDWNKLHGLGGLEVWAAELT